MNINRIKKIFLISLLSFSPLLASCNAKENEGDNIVFIKDDKVRVTLIDSKHVIKSSESIVTQKGNDVIFNIEFEENYTIDSCSIWKAKIEVDDKNPEKCLLTIPSVTKDTRFTVIGKEIQNRIIYEFKEGIYKNKNYYIQNYTSTRRKRVNTINAEEVICPGYAFIGWNTKEDYTGKFITAGSRFTPFKKQRSLYAVYKKEADEKLFRYKGIDSTSVEIESYIGEATNSLVMPSKIDGKDVVSIGEKFNLSFDIDELILPKTLKTINKEARFAGKITKLFFYDTLNEVYDENFNNVEKIHIIANERPKFIYNDFAFFADAIDNMIVPDFKETIYLYSGCSFTYGCYSEFLEQILGYKYSVYNLGLIGGISAYFQFDIITNYIRKNDILIHAPEEGAPAQFLFYKYVDERMFIMCESNYDLLTVPTMDHMVSYFEAFRIYKASKNKIRRYNKYEDVNTHFNDRGDYVTNRPFYDLSEYDKQYGVVPYSPALDFVKEDVMQKFEPYYKKINEKGAKTLFSYSPMNRQAIPLDEIKNIELFDEGIKKYFLNHPYVSVISNLNDYIFDGRYFFDADYHLNSEGAKIRTQKLGNDIVKYLDSQLS